MIMYNLSICSVDSETIYGLIASDKKKLLEFLKTYDHEGSSLVLVRKEENSNRFTDIPVDYIYEELSK